MQVLLAAQELNKALQRECLGSKKFDISPQFCRVLVEERLLRFALEAVALCFVVLSVCLPLSFLL